MQTLQQKREYTVAVLDPAGNVTAIVCSDVPAAERARVAAQILRLPELGIEQVAFLTAPRSGGEIRLEMMGGEFCGNALRCAGFYQALRNGEQGKSCVLAEISGADGVQPVMADTAEGTASTVMPLPLSVQPAGWADVKAARVTFAGITHFVIDCAQPDETLVQRAIAAAPEASAVGAIFLDRAHGSIKPVVFVRETASCVAENSCASGSVAAAVVLTADFADGITEIGIGQPGGTLEVGVQRTDGAVTGFEPGAYEVRVKDRRRGAPDADADCHAAGSGGSAVLIRKLCLHIGA